MTEIEVKGIKGYTEKNSAIKYPLKFRKNNKGILFTKVQTIAHVIVLFFIIVLFYKISSMAIKHGVNGSAPVLFFLLFAFFMVLYALLSIFPAFIVDVFEGGAEITIYEDGFVDTRISENKLSWSNFSNPKIVETNLKGIVYVRLKIKNRSSIKYRNFRYDISFQKYFAPIRNNYVYIPVRFFHTDPNIIVKSFIDAYSYINRINKL